jgi:hypothetical protein
MLLAPPANIPIRILADKDRWGRQVNRPLTTIYTVEYADLGKGMPPPGQMTVNDMMARARAIMSGPVASNNAVAAATNSLASQNRLGAQVVPTILIATDPPGLDVMVDGNRVRTPASFHWKLGSYHLLIAFHERQTPSQGNQGAAEYYNYGRWKPGPNGDQMPIQVPGFWNARTLTYTARFSRVDSPGTASQPSIPAGIKK